MEAQKYVRKRNFLSCNRTSATQILFSYSKKDKCDNEMKIALSFIFRKASFVYLDIKKVLI